MKIVRSPGGGRLFHLLDDRDGLLGKFSNLADAALVRRYLGGAVLANDEKLEVRRLLRQLDGERNE